MKGKSIFFSLALGFAMVLVAFGCKKDADSTTPTNVESRTKFLGNYNVNDTTHNLSLPDSTFESYIMTISKDTTDTTGIILSNFGNSGTLITAEVSGSVFTMQNQPYTGSWTIHGTGTISGNVLRFSTVISWVDQVDRFGTAIKF